MRTRDIVVVAASTGGLEALTRLFAHMPADLPAAIFVVMHTGAHESILPSLLQKTCELRVQHAIHEEVFENGRIYIAPPDRHLLLSEGKTWLSDGPKEHFTRPAADPLFRSAAIEYGPRVIGVILTGDLDDGAAGIKALRACGGYAVIQDPVDCDAPSMPRNAIQATSVQVVAPIAELGAAIIRALEPIMDNPQTEDARVRQVAEIEDKIARDARADLTDLETIGGRSALTCPDCGGVVWKIGEGAPLRFRCHTGHGFSAAALENDQRVQSENAVWRVIRIIEEQIFLAQELVQMQSGGDGENGLVSRISDLESAREAAVNILRRTRSTVEV